MEQIVLVKNVREDGLAEVIALEEGGCGGDCKHCGGCSPEHRVMLAQNPVRARCGDYVTVEAKSGALLKAAAALYVLPVLLFVAGYLLGENLWQQGIPVSLGGLLLGFLLVKLLDRHMTKKGSAYIITGLAKGPQANNTEKRG